ncbi:MAG: TROVE domain-containing protein [Armatimonadetes bacterium]|nr:TROVE domain-containing protein [Armatimonadota bacterium]
MKYTQLFHKAKTRQSQPIAGSGQTRNSAGGYGWDVDRWEMLDRFLILGSETGTVYVAAQKLTADHARNVIEAIKDDGVRAVARIVEVSTRSLAPKNDAAVFALALAAAHGDEKTRKAAFDAVSQVCRTGTHLFAFADACDSLRGWGRGLRRAVGNWYNAQSAEDLAYGLVKYQIREGWSHRDLLRLAHPVAATPDHDALFQWAVSKELKADIPLVSAVLALRQAKDLDTVCELIREFRIPREAVPTEMLTEPRVWEALLDDMPLTAMLRNLGNLSKLGVLRKSLFGAHSPGVDKVVSTLENPVRLRKSRVHPVAVLAALTTYASGRGFRGDGSWKPVQRVVDALDRAFYDSFANVEPTGKRIVLALDVSGSMAGTLVAGVVGLDCRRACGAMALATAASEKSASFLAFDTSVYPLAIDGSMRLDTVASLLAKTGGGGTDCAAPIQHMVKKKVEADAIILYTDSETWYGSQHPAEAMADYRRKVNRNAKLVVVAMASNRTSVADPLDPLTLNVVGFDVTVPNLIAQFVNA